MIGIVDFCAGNLASVQNALEKIGAKFFVSDDEKKLAAAEKIIFPGVGHARDAMRNLREKNLINFLKNCEKPLLGICLGAQILLDFSEESGEKTLEILAGKVRKFDKNCGEKIPHIGWNSVFLEKKNPLFEKISQNSDFYFVHSFFCDLKNSAEICGRTPFGKKKFCSFFHKKNFFGAQFHPEKSGKNGAQFLQNFVNLK